MEESHEGERRMKVNYANRKRNGLLVSWHFIDSRSEGNQNNQRLSENPISSLLPVPLLAPRLGFAWRGTVRRWL